MKIIIVTVLLTLLAAAAVSAASIVGYKMITNHSEPTREPDRVVGVSAKCQLVSAGQPHDMTGSYCQQGDRTVNPSTPSSYAIINSRLELSVRTSEGSTYQVEVPITTNVNVGDTWPK